MVENDPYTRTTLKRILQARYQVFEAENDRQALLRVKQCEPHLVILDFHLPSVNIPRLCQKIKRENGGGEHSGDPGEKLAGAGEG
ncbi:MAG: response regulator [Candidatus Tectomicrobia bacterium]|uniref:Response regulator n=1 Tax=Tectimicrobiota bacterium TaxID=2528274 RepID=A0A932M1C3_UNCTE|nr:response regulator [Candidatus Tectomicrobia bacterium]